MALWANVRARSLWWVGWGGVYWFRRLELFIGKSESINQFSYSDIVNRWTFYIGGIGSYLIDTIIACLHS